MPRISVEGVPCFEHQVIQDEVLPDVPPRFPFSKRLLDELVTNCPVVTAFPAEESTSAYDFGIYNATGRAEGSEIGLRRVSKQHGRSYELFFGADDAKVPQTIWEDEFGNEYSSLNLKGTNFTGPRIMKSLTAPSGYIPYGLLETDAFLRVVRASRIMRENGLATEMIVKVLEPKFLRYYKADPETGKSLPDQFEYVPQNEFKRRLLIDHWAKIEDKTGAVEEMGKVAAAINTMSYFFTLRATGAAPRLLDLVTEDKDIFTGEVQKVFASLNARLKVYAEQSDEDLVQLSTESDKDMRDYLYTFLPRWIGQNLGRLHKLGLVHTFPVFGNMTLMGELVDLDAVRGEPLGLGDEPVTEQDLRNDIEQACGDLREHADECQAFFALAEEFFGGPEEEGVGSGHKLFRANLVEQYVCYRFDIDEEPHINQFKEEKLLHDLPLIQEYLKRGVDINTLFLTKVLESAFRTDKFPRLYTEAELKQLGEQYTEWLRPELLDYMREKALNLLNEVPVADIEYGNGEWFFHREANKFLNRQGADYRRTNFIRPLLEEPEVQADLRKWVVANKKQNCTWSDESLFKLLETSIVDDAMTELAFLAIENGLGPAQAFNLNKHTIFKREFDEAKGVEPFKLVGDGRLLLVRDQTLLSEVMENLSDDMYGQPFDVIHEGGHTKCQSISLSVPDGYMLGELVTDMRVDHLEIDEREDKCMGQITLKAHGVNEHTYFAYTLIRHENGKTTLFIAA